MIVFDIEWNHGRDDIPLDEILQIGAVRLDRLGGKIEDTFAVNIRPVVHKELGVAAREVLDLDDFLASDLDFAAAMERFGRWCGEERLFAAWGNSDLEVLRRNCEYWNVPQPEMDKVYDIQASFSAVVGTRQNVALYRAAEYCGIPDCFDCHNALHDAVYTAMIGEWIPADGLLLRALPRRLQRLAGEKFPRQPRRRVGPFRSVEDALNAWESRRAFCPQCGRKMWVQTWVHATPEKYFADLRCPEHGWHIYRLTLDRGEDNQWRGRMTAPAMTEKTMQEFHAATKAERYACKTMTKKRKRRRKH